VALISGVTNDALTAAASFNKTHVQVHVVFIYLFIVHFIVVITCTGLDLH